MPRPVAVATTEPGREQYVPSGGIASGVRSMFGPPSSEPGVPLLEPPELPRVGAPLLMLPELLSPTGERASRSGASADPGLYDTPTIAALEAPKPGQDAR